MPTRNRFGIACLVAASAALLALPAAAGQPLTSWHDGFYPPRSNTGASDNEAWYGNAADLDGDGRDELITAGWVLSASLTRVRVHSFAPGVWGALSVAEWQVSGADTPSEVEAADLNNDGVLDLVTTTPDTVCILPGTTPGQFGACIKIATPGAFDLAVADLDSDGLSDLAVALPNLKTLRLLKGIGAFGFTLLANLPIPGGGFLVNVAQLDGNTTPDLVVASDTTRVLLGLGGGAFAPFDVPAAGLVPAGDLNGDGHGDLLARNGSYLGHGDGTFGPRLPFLPAHACLTADFDEDGRLDLVARTLATPRRLVWQRGLGDGTFSPSQVVLDPSTTSPDDLAIGDFDGDGHLDVAQPARNVEPNLITYGSGNGPGRDAPLTVALPSPSRFLAAGKLNGDAYADLVSLNATAKSMTLLRSTGPAAWGAPDTLVLPGTPVNRALVLGDLNADGREDIVVGYTDVAVLSYWLTQPNGLPGPRTDLPVLNFPTVDLALADMDGDGDRDIVYEPTSSVATSNGIRWFAAPAFAGENVVPCSALFGFTVGALDGDALPDLAWLDSARQLHYALATAPGVYGTPVPLLRPIGNPTTALEMGDWNGDGWNDLAFQGSPELWVSVNAGAGAMGPLTGHDRMNAIAEPSRAADFDGDGRSELVGALSAAGPKLVRFQSNGSPLDARLAGGSLVAGSHGVAAGDFDGNGTMDLVTGSPSLLTLDVLLNRREPRIVSVPPLPAPARGLALAAVRNPVGSTLALQLASALAGDVQLELLDVQGRRVREARVRLEAGGTRRVSLGPVTGLANGVYFARARAGAHEANARLHVIR